MRSLLAVVCTIFAASSVLWVTYSQAVIISFGISHGTNVLQFPEYALIGDLLVCLILIRSTRYLPPALLRSFAPYLWLIPAAMQGLIIAVIKGVGQLVAADHRIAGLYFVCLALGAFVFISALTTLHDLLCRNGSLPEC